ncbi:MAG: HAD hydrolase family protein [Patescibacteria group bacterium]|nr:HAD hydrolase family protein [Patescibacteria group bacterium]
MKKHKTSEADVFDLDGTVIGSNILKGLVMGLDTEIKSKKQGYYPAKKKLKFQKLLNSGREPKLSVGFEPDPSQGNVISLVESGFFIGMKVDHVKERIYAGMDQILQTRNDFTQLLILALRRRKPRRLIICITGTPHEIANAICPFFGFDFAIGCMYAQSSGIYTDGKSNLDSGLNKGKVMDELSRDCGIVWKDAIALGDSPFDLEMFERSKYPIAINPNKKLQKIIRTTRNPNWVNGTIPWIDHIEGDALEGVHIWLPNNQGLLTETYVNSLLPEDVINVMSDIYEERLNGCYL